MNETPNVTSRFLLFLSLFATSEVARPAEHSSMLVVDLREETSAVYAVPRGTTVTVTTCPAPTPPAPTPPARRLEEILKGVETNGTAPSDLEAALKVALTADRALPTAGYRWVSGEGSLPVFILAPLKVDGIELTETGREDRPSPGLRDLQELLKLVDLLGPAAAPSPCSAPFLVQQRTLEDIGERKAVTFSVTGAIPSATIPSLADQIKKLKAEISAEPDSLKKARLEARLRSLKASEAFEALEEGAESLAASGLLDPANREKYNELAVFLAAHKPNNRDAKPTDPVVRKASFVLLTGPASRFSISGDIPITEAEQLKLNDDGELEVEGEGSSAYVGFNLHFGDRDVAYRGGQFLKNLSLKAMIRASSRPGDSYGVALAFNNLSWKGGVFVLRGFSPWVGYTFTKEDEMPSEGSSGKGLGRNGELRFGFSVSLTTLAGLLSPSDGGDTE